MSDIYDNVSDPETFFFFWKRAELSQWGEFSIDIPNVLKFNCAEQGMMYAKAMLHVQSNFSNVKTALKILQTNYPAEQKRLGRLVTGFDQKRWDQVKFDVIYTLNWFKFTQNEQCKSFLLSITQDTLVEASPFDPIWGIGLSADDSRARQRSTWLGENLLGQVLTMVRNDIIAEEPDLNRLAIGGQVLSINLSNMVDLIELLKHNVKFENALKVAFPS